MRHLDGTPCANGSRDGSDVCFAHTKRIITMGQILFETWAQNFEARPVWVDLPYHIQQKWEETARILIDKHIENMVETS